MAIGETVLGAVLGVVLDRLASWKVINFLRRSKIDQSVIDELKRVMLAAEKLLLDAEQKQITERPVKEWLDELQHWFCRAEEVVDEIATEALQSSLKSSSHGTPSRRTKVRNFVPSLWSSFLFERTITRDISEIVSALERMLAHNDVLGLRELSGRGAPLRDSRATTSVPEDPKVYGRDQDREELLKFLLSKEAGGNSLRIAAIVGRGGIGKTTLAKTVFNDPTVQETFELRAWVCVSDQFDVHRVTMSILESMTQRSESIALKFLQNKLRSELGNKKFLLVLDDIWNDNYHRWQTLRAPLLAGTNGSKIIVITRNAKVANIMRASCPVFSLKPLSDDDGWSLFSRHAFGGANLRHNPRWEHIGRKIVRKCGHLPLAIKALGGLLGTRCNIEYWEEILHSSLWDLPHDNNNVIPALWLSYYYLPQPLKRCFSHCAIFPEAHKIGRKQLVHLWMAENFLSDKGKGMEEEGFGYIDDLLSGSFLEPIDESYVMMHDLMYDLARRVFGNLLARPEPETPSKFARHFSYSGGHCDGITKFQAIKGSKYLRSVLKLGTSWGYGCCLTDEVPSIIKPSFSCLRVLSLSGYRNLRLPELVECPKQLRYLDVSGSEIKQLPKWVSTLCNLQTLILSNCTKLERLPADMWRLVSLRHLDIRGATLVSHMPTGMGKLKDLRTLTDFVVGKDVGLHIQELSKLKEIRGKFAIRQLQNVANPSDAGAVNLRNRTLIDDLELEFDYKFVYEECIELLKSLKPCLEVKSLTIRGYGGATLPKWLGVGCAEYSKIKFLCLSYCRFCSSLPPLGQLSSLKELTIEGMDGIQQVGHEFCGDDVSGPFPNLESLSFRDMNGWHLWSNVDAEGGAVCFPRLKKLFLTDCPNLKGNLPVHTPSLVKLAITGCVLLRRLLPTVPSAHVPVLQLETCPFPHAELPKALVVSSITYLSLKGLLSLVKLPIELVMLSSLSNLSIADCDNLKSLADVQLPSSLKSLEISRCDALESLPEAMESLPRFQNLKVDRCQHLLWFPGSSLPTSLRSLTVSECDRWEFPISMERMQHYTCLEHLDLRHTSKHLVSFPLGIFPNLRYLWFDNCEGLEKVYIPEGIEADNLVSLSELRILQCHALEMVGKETGRGEATTEFSAPNLADFFIHGCEKVKPVNIEKEGEVLLPELRLLQITNSATGALPHGVRRSLLKFSYLEFLLMDGLEVECFPVTGESLPTSLTWLIIKNFRKLRKLDGEALHRLKYLTILYIWDCPELERLPEKGLLPLSLDVLFIRACPKLEKRCKPQKGKDWSKIHHIPLVEFRE